MASPSFTPTRREQAELDSAKLAATKSSYETDALMAQYLSLHFGPEDAFAEFVGETGVLKDALGFPQKCGELVLRWAAQRGTPTGRALDLGCAVGRSTFEMARSFSEVIGIDLSQTFIDAADAMKQRRRIDYALKVEGELTQEMSAVLPADVDTSRVTFVQVRARRRMRARAACRARTHCPIPVSHLHAACVRVRPAASRALPPPCRAPCWHAGRRVRAAARARHL